MRSRREQGIDYRGDRLRAAAAAHAVPRAAGTPADAQVRARLAAELRNAGYTVEEQPFGIHLWRPLAVLRGGLLAGAAGCTLVALARRRRALPLLAGPTGLGLAALGAGGALSGLGLLGQPGAGGARTANLVASRVVPHARYRVVIVAHHDSKSQSYPLVVRGALGAAAGAGAGIALARWLGLLGGGDGWLGAGWSRWGALAGAAGLVGLAGMTFGNRSPGALDNAGSVAVALDLARRLAVRPVPDVEAVVVLTGAEEALMAGARLVAPRLAREAARRPTLVLNLDGVGAPGRVGLVGPRSLVDWGLRAAGAAGVRARRMRWPPVTRTDADVFEAAGLPALTLTSGGVSRAALAVHSRHDRIEGLDPAALAAAAALAARLVEELRAGFPGG